MALEHESESALARAVRKVGSQTAFGRLIGKRQSVIHGWLRDDRALPIEYVKVVADATGIPAIELCPAISGILEQEPPMPGAPPGGMPAEPTQRSAGVPESLKGLQS